jgi:hypothetical protein
MVQLQISVDIGLYSASLLNKWETVEMLTKFLYAPLDVSRFEPRVRSSAAVAI